MCLLEKRGNLVQYHLDLDPPPKVIFFEIESRSFLQLNFTGKSNSKWFKGEDEPKPRPATETPAPAWKPEVFYNSLHEKKIAVSSPSELHEIAILTKYQKVTETYRKQETVVNFDTTNRRGGGEVGLRNGYRIG